MIEIDIDMKKTYNQRDASQPVKKTFSAGS